jgi:acyl-CoA thioester hydrolase
MKHDPLTYRGVVYPWHCDAERMNAMGFAAAFQDAQLHLLERLGLGPGWRQARRSTVAATEQHLRYLREPRDGDVVTVHTRVVAISANSMHLVHEMRDEASGAVAATCELLGVQLAGAQPLPAFVAERAQWL